MGSFQNAPGRFHQLQRLGAVAWLGQHCGRAQCQSTRQESMQLSNLRPHLDITACFGS